MVKCVTLRDYRYDLGGIPRVGSFLLSDISTLNGKVQNMWGGFNQRGVRK